MQGQLPGGHEKSIVVTLVQSVRLLGEEGLQLLRLAGELHGGTPVTFRLARATLGRAFSLNDQDTEEYFARAVNQLESHSLATVSLGGAAGDILTIHSMVCYTMVHGDPAGSEAAELRKTLLTAAVSALNEILEDVVDIRTHARLEFELDNARHLVPTPRTANEARLTNWLARHEGERGSYREARAIALMALPILEHNLGPDHPDTLATRSNIASWTGETGDPHEALRLFRELLPDLARLLGPNHPYTAVTREWITFLQHQEK